MITFPVPKRYSGEVLFEANIGCVEGEAHSLKLGLAVQWAIANYASLCYADLRGASLQGANLSNVDLACADLQDANLRGASLLEADLQGARLINVNLQDANLAGAKGIYFRIIDAGLCSRGNRLFLTRFDLGEWRIRAGDHNFSVDDAFAHWNESHPYGAETRLILNHALAIAKHREWPECTSKAAAA